MYILVCQTRHSCLLTFEVSLYIYRQSDMKKEKKIKHVFLNKYNGKNIFFILLILCIHAQVYKILESESFSSQTEWMGRAEVGRVEILLKSISQKKNVYKRFKFSATKVSFMPFITYTQVFYYFYIWPRNLCFTIKMTQQISKYKNSNY